MNDNTLTRTPLHTAGSRDIVAFASAPVTGPTLLEAIHGGSVRFAKVREQGTLRGWPVLKPGSSERKSAESLAAAVAKKVPVAALAKEANVSVATLRRTLTSLSFTLELEALSAKERAAVAKSVNKPEPKAPKAEKPAKEEPKAPAAKPARKASTRKTAAKGTKSNPGKGGFVAQTKAGKAAVARKERSTTSEA
jgi:hypothetical protein